MESRLWIVQAHKGSALPDWDQCLYCLRDGSKRLLNFRSPSHSTSWPMYNGGPSQYYGYKCHWLFCSADLKKWSNYFFFLFFFPGQNLFFGKKFPECMFCIKSNVWKMRSCSIPFASSAPRFEYDFDRWVDRRCRQMQDVLINLNSNTFLAYFWVWLSITLAVEDANQNHFKYNLNSK